MPLKNIKRGEMMNPDVNKLTSKYRTRNPIEIAQCLGFIIIHTSLVGVRGFYQHIQRNHIVYLDDSLDEPNEKFVCAHEIGHAILHKDINRIFMDTRTLSVSSKYEAQANRFAIDLLYSDEDMKEYEGYTISDVASCLGLSECLIEYRLNSIKRADV
jgi:Zn-dependent peptidase ImmA (M78 family)